MNTIKQTLFALLIVTIALSGCKKDVAPNIYVNDTESFKPSNKISIENGMLTFSDVDAMNMTILEMQLAGRSSVQKWEEEMGIETFANRYSKMLTAEDSISKHYENLSAKEQEYWFSQPPIHSTEYKNALAEGWIREVKEDDGSTSIVLNFIDNSMCDVINLKGWVKVGNQIIQVTPEAHKVILNGDTKLINVIAQINQPVKNDQYIIRLKSSNLKLGTIPGFNWSKDVEQAIISPAPEHMSGGWLYYNKNWRGVWKNRFRVRIDGYSRAYDNPPSNNCTSVLACTFDVRAQSEWKNGWGNWQGGDQLALNVNNSWVYWVGKYTDVSYGCGSNPGWILNIPLNSSSACWNGGPCPSSPFNYSVNTNNSFIPQQPHTGGYWSAGSGPWFSDAFYCQGTLIATYGGTTFTYNYSYNP